MEVHFLNSSDISVTVETRGEICESIRLTKALGELQLSLIVLKWASAKLQVALRICIYSVKWERRM